MGNIDEHFEDENRTSVNSKCVTLLISNGNMHFDISVFVVGVIGGHHHGEQRHVLLAYN